MPEPYTQIIYVAGPYRCPIKRGIQHNIDRALVAAQRLWGMGYVAFCPHANTVSTSRAATGGFSAATSKYCHGVTRYTSSKARRTAAAHRPK